MATKSVYYEYNGKITKIQRTDNSMDEIRRAAYRWLKSKPEYEATAWIETGKKGCKMNKVLGNTDNGKTGYFIVYRSYDPKGPQSIVLPDGTLGKKIIIW